MNNFGLLLFNVFILLCTQLKAQEFEYIKQNFPDANAVYLKKEVHAIFGKRGESISLVTKNLSSTLFLNDNANLYTDKNIYYSGLILVNDIDAKTEVVEGDKVKVFRSSKILEKDVVSPGIFYDDMKVKEVVYPNIKKGAKAILSYTSEYLEHRLFGPVLLSSNFPVVESVFKVTVQKDLKIKYSYIGIDEKKIIFTTQTKGDEIIYTWVAKNLPAHKYVANSPNIRYYEPQIVVYISELISKDKVINVAENKQGLHKWCSGFLKDINSSSESILKPALDSIIIGATSDSEKSKKIFYWVQDHIKYIAFEDGYSGYIPRNADDVYSKRYGDCKDMANLLTVFHKMAGLKAYHTWIGTRDIPYKIDNMPMSCNFNHMICTAFIDNKWCFLDATGRAIPFGFPTSMIQGKEGMLSFSKDSAIVLNIPEVNSNLNIELDEIELFVKDKAIVGTGIKTTKGLSMVSTIVPLSYSSKTEKGDYLKELLLLGSNKCTFNDIKFSSENDYKLDEHKIFFQYSIPDYVLQLPEETYVNMNLRKDFSEDKIDITSRKVDYELEFKKMIEQKMVLTIPQGYSVSYLPSNYEFQTKDFSFSITYENLGDKVQLIKKIKIDFLLLTPSSFEQWNQMINKLNKAYKETVALKKK